MAAPRAMQLGFRRAGLATKTTFRTVQRRLASTEPMAESEASSQILAKQRLARPVSPHLTIFKPNIAMYGSAFNRITGSVLSGGLYIFGFLYLVAPPLGWHVETPSLVAKVKEWPGWAKFAAKFPLAFFFFFHSFNGLRHLVWDTGRAFANRTVARTGWFVVGLTTVASIYASL